MTMFSSRNWREYPQRYRLEASKFKKSGKTYYPPRQVDPETGEFKKLDIVVADRDSNDTFDLFKDEFFAV